MAREIIEKFMKCINPNLRYFFNFYGSKKNPIKYVYVYDNKIDYQMYLNNEPYYLSDEFADFMPICEAPENVDDITFLDVLLSIMLFNNVFGDCCFPIDRESINKLTIEELNSPYDNHPDYSDVLKRKKNDGTEEYIDRYYKKLEENFTVSNNDDNITKYEFDFPDIDEVTKNLKNILIKEFEDVSEVKILKHDPDDEAYFVFKHRGILWDSLVRQNGDSLSYFSSDNEEEKFQMTEETTKSLRNLLLK